MAGGHQSVGSPSAEIGRRLERAGQRWTQGRRLVVGVVSAASAPMSVPEIQRALAQDVPLSSLYRIIGDLVDARVLVKLEFAEGFARFELADDLAEHHHHLVCRNCGDVRDLRLDGLERSVDEVTASILERSGFVIDSHRIDFFGTCRNCAEARE